MGQTFGYKHQLGPKLQLKTTKTICKDYHSFHYKDTNKSLKELVLAHVVNKQNLSG